MVLASVTLMSPTAGLILWTVAAVATYATIGWLVLIVVPRLLFDPRRRQSAELDGEYAAAGPFFLALSVFCGWIGRRRAGTPR